METRNELRRPHSGGGSGSDREDRARYGRQRRGGGHEGRSSFGGPRFGRGKGGRGDVRAALLLQLAEGPFNGYQLIQQIDQRSGGIWQPSPGSVYPALQLLEDEGLVQAEEVEGKRMFQLTEAGRNHVEEHRAELVAAWDSVTGAVDDAMVELRSLFEQLGAAVKQVAHAGTDAQIAEAQRLLANTRRQLYRILAEDPASGEGV